MDAVSAQPGSGLGLRNTRERLAQIYGSDARLLVTSDPASGTSVVIEIAGAHTRSAAPMAADD
jgi:sensor histidine kinase YesM